MLTGAGFVMVHGGIALRDLGWKRVHRSSPVAWIMTEDVATLPIYAGSTYAELDELEQKIMLKFPAPRNYLIWQYIKINSDGTQQRCNLAPPKSVSRFVAIDAKKRKHEETKELVDDDDGTDGISVAAAPERSPEGSPDQTAIATISPNTPPKDTSPNVYANTPTETMNNDEQGTQLFHVESEGEQDGEQTSD